jgi:hypothetical protein
MVKKKSSLITAPDWYPLAIYTKNLSSKELLDEICKRHLLINHLSNPALTQQQQEASFYKLIIENKLLPASINLKKTTKKPHPIQTISVFEILHMSNQIRNSQWYSMLEDREQLEQALSNLSDRQPSSPNQYKLFEKYLGIPWDKFQPFNQSELINKYSNGIPVTIDTGIDREDIITELRNILNRHQGNKLWALSQKVFDSWQRKKIFAICDLKTWFKIKNIKYKKTDLARIVWGSRPPISPNHDTAVNIKAYINDAIKESQEVINMGTIRPLWLYCESEMRSEL